MRWCHDIHLEVPGSSYGRCAWYLCCLLYTSYMMDEKYEELEPTISEDADCYEVLLYLNRELLTMIEESINVELLTRLYSTQLTTHGERPLLDHGRTYYKLLKKIISRGREKKELRTDMSVSEMVRY